MEGGSEAGNGARERILSRGSREGKEKLGGRGGAGRVRRREAEKQERKERNGDKEWSMRHYRGGMGK